ncbi:MAG: DUF4012 domain-containing protein [Chloroflexota bacterium]|nr:DUF4012 domain-containing protein [Chloroflexota bacterium]
MERELVKEQPRLFKARESLAEAIALRRSALKDPWGPYASFVRQLDAASAFLGDVVDISIVAPSLLPRLFGMEQRFTDLLNPPFKADDPLSVLQQPEALDKYQATVEEAIRQLGEFEDEVAKVRLFREREAAQLPDSPLLTLVEAAYYGVGAIAPVLEAARTLATLADVPTLLTPEFGQQATRVVPEAEDDVQRAKALMDRAVELAGRVEATLPPGMSTGPIGRAVASVKTANEQVEQLGAAVHLLKFALGLDGPRFYLILGQDDEELRPTGGFIGVIQEMTVEGGVLRKSTFRNAYDVDTSESAPFVMKAPAFKWMPEPFAMALFGADWNPWYFRDTNWSGDFPTSAIEAAESYRRANNGVSPDGVFGTTQELIVNLVDALGGLKLKGVEGVIHGADARLYIKYEKVYPVRPDHVSRLPNRAFVQDLSEAIQERFQRGLTRSERRAVFAVLLQALKEKSLQIYLADPESRTLLRSLGWDGAIPLATQDYLYVVESNIIACKCSQKIERSVRYQVQLNEEGKGEAELQVSYYNPFQTTGTELYNQGTTVGMARGGLGYYSYLKVYTPAQITLLEPLYVPLPEGALYASKAPLGQVLNNRPNVLVVSPQHNLYKTDLGLFFLVKQKERKTLRFRYNLPTVVNETERGTRVYGLYLEKQSGVQALPVEVQLTLPPRSQLSGSLPAPEVVSGNRLTYRLQLDQSKEIRVEFR